MHASQLKASHAFAKVVTQTQKICKRYRACIQLVSSSFNIHRRAVHDNEGKVH